MKKNKPLGGGSGQKQLQPANNAQPFDAARRHEIALDATRKQQAKQVPAGKK